MKVCTDIYGPQEHKFYWLWWNTVSQHPLDIFAQTFVQTLMVPRKHVLTLVIPTLYRCHQLQPHRAISHKPAVLLEMSYCCLHCLLCSAFNLMVMSFCMKLMKWRAKKKDWFYICMWLMVISYLCFFNRISQDLAKDLAMLAREIHDVAGEIDSVSPAATDPGALVTSKH